jgi:GNAT superfamily N-acetyltransferase
MWTIRPAHPAEAAQACQILRDSITQLCLEDHDGQPAALSAWLANKTVETVRGWIESNPKGFLVAAGPDGIGAVGSVTPRGAILLNYVAPAARFQGASTTLLRGLEARAAAWGAKGCTLTSTATARLFYLAHGYVEETPIIRSFGGKPAFPMHRLF